MSFWTFAKLYCITTQFSEQEPNHAIHAQLCILCIQMPNAMPMTHIFIDE